MVLAEGLQRVLAVGLTMEVPRVQVEGVEEAPVGSLAEAEVQLEDVADPLNDETMAGGAKLATFSKHIWPQSLSI
ncbi:unnamed protein product [Linum trigynum]|uniref:Uncharacterized protein n=1 Tax=Linum trigynum TaxID=586398 RepID=A0AAV2FKZ2_9ROSI